MEDHLDRLREGVQRETLNLKPQTPNPKPEIDGSLRNSALRQHKGDPEKAAAEAIEEDLKPGLCVECPASGGFRN